MKKFFPVTGSKTGATLAAALCLVFLILATHDARAVPACPVPITVQQPDGQTIQVYLRGDEFLHWNEDAAGFTILKEEQTGRWVYAVRDAGGNLVPGSLVVGRGNPQSLGVPRHLLPVGAKEQSQAARAERQKTAAANESL